MKLIAINVNNLTDARYLAARGVDTICFDTDQINAMEINAIKAWLDVPNFALQISKEKESDCQQWMEETDIELCLFEYTTDFTLPNGVRQYALILESSAKPTLLTEAAEWVVADPSFSKDHIQSLSLDHTKAENLPENLTGFCVYGGNEERAGLMSFEDKDELLDWYEERYLYGV